MLTEKQIELLSIHTAKVFNSILEFYKNPENEKEFQQWLKEKKYEKNL